MNFIEKIFHVAPDGGSGLLEYTILVALLMPAVAILRFVGLRKVLSGWPTRLHQSTNQIPEK